MNKLRAEAESLRNAGYTYNMITESIGVSKGTLSYWFKDMPFSPNKEAVSRIKYGPIKSGALRHNKKLANIKHQHSLGKAEIGRLSRRDLWMLGIGLYIGEGAKTTEGIRVSNSDPIVIATAMGWLKKICGLTDDNFTIRLHLYPDHDELEAKMFWQSITGLPLESFRKTIIDARNKKSRKNYSKLPYGTAHLSVVSKGDPTKGVALYRRIEGWILGAVNQV